LPILFGGKSPTDVVPLYPAIKVNMSKYKSEINEILEETMEEKRQESFIFFEIKKDALMRKSGIVPPTSRIK
jgi:hypothetical protein